MKSFTFRHERMDVYRVALELLGFVNRLGSRWFLGRPDRKSQLLRAADSIVLDIAEGINQAYPKVQRRHFSIAMGSAGECHAILQAMEMCGCPSAPGIELLRRVGAMLARLIHPCTP